MLKIWTVSDVLLDSDTQNYSYNIGYTNWNANEGTNWFNPFNGQQNDKNRKFTLFRTVIAGQNSNVIYSSGVIQPASAQYERKWLYAFQMNGAGLYKETVMEGPQGSPWSANYTPIQPVTLYTSYIAIEKSVVVGKINNIIANGANYTTGTAINLDFSLSKGYEVSKNLTIQKGTGSNIVTAVENVDYTLVDLGGFKYTITFLTPNTVFTISVSIQGYTSYNNPWLLASASQRNYINTNSAQKAFTFTGEVEVEDPEDPPTTPPPPPIYKIPQIQPLFEIDNFELSTTPETTYISNPIIIKPNILFETGQYTNNGEVIPLSNQQWLDYMQSNCNLELFIIAINNGATEVHLTGASWDGNEIVIDDINNYKVYYKTNANTWVITQASIS